MKNLELKDRIVVEFLAPENEVVFTPDFIAGQLRAVADAIQAGRSGDNYLPWQDNEILWEHESIGYSGFRILSDKSLISQYFYHSEKRPFILSFDTLGKVVDWLKMMTEKEANGDEYKYTDGDLVDSAHIIMESIVEQFNEQAK